MKIVRLQFETRYTYLLEFKEKYKALLNPFLILKDLKFSVGNEGSMNESIKFSFEESGYEIEIMMDRMVYRYEGDPENLLKSTSQIKLYFDILEKIKTIDSFQKNLLNILAVWAVHPTELTEENNIKKFKEKYLSKNIDLIDNVKDYMLVVNSGDESKFTTINFGPYTSKDFKKHKMSLFNTEYSNQFKNIQGLMGVVQINEKKDKSRHEDFKALYGEVKGLLNKLTEEYEK